MSHGDRLPIVGTVTKGGEPIEDKATIYFEPVDGADGVGSSGQVDSGTFSIPLESGPTPGKEYKVRLITSPGIPPDGTPRDEIKQPQRFDTRVEIPERQGGAAPQQVDVDFE